ncbi:hypothetical protein CC78DRAFT_571481 [Lojkania enalia]|uniref:Uncharacterized protein n=1 Tax=Lojkania enalia TaxID=147567 RepID=A0A9P4K205_9PLEO|nr:hypothetical protein CC78DRAFT_571481 [Didymosphaeria enalia]
MSTPWVPPDFRTLDFAKNCTKVATFAAEWNQDEDMARSALPAVVSFFRMALSPEDKKIATAGNIVDWYLDIQGSDRNGIVSNEFHQHVIKAPLQRCQKETCRVMEWPGNPDIAGIGMVASYSIQAISITIIFIACALDHYYRRRNPKSHVLNGILYRRFIGPLTSDLHVFVEASSLMSFTFTIALFHLKRRTDKGEAVTNQEVMLTWLASAFSLFPTYTSYALFADEEKRYRDRGVQWFYIIIACLLSVPSWFFYVGPPKPRRYGWWESICMTRKESLKAWITPLQNITITFLVLTWIWMLTFWGSRVGTNGKSPKRKSLRVVLRWILASFLLTLTWALFGLLMSNRKRYIDKAGDDNAENVWTFGQILALFTWFAVCWQFLYSIIKGVKNAAPTEGQEHESTAPEEPVKLEQHKEPDVDDEEISLLPLENVHQRNPITIV